MNLVVLVGRLTRDPELKKTSTGKSYLRFSLAVNRFKDTTDFINCVAWEREAELLSTYCSKGKRIGVQGSIITGEYTSNEGETRRTTEVNVTRVELLDSSTNNNSQPMSRENTQDMAKSFDDIDEEDDFPF